MYYSTNCYMAAVALRECVAQQLQAMLFYRFFVWFWAPPKNLANSLVLVV